MHRSANAKRRQAIAGARAGAGLRDLVYPEEAQHDLREGRVVLRVQEHVEQRRTLVKMQFSYITLHHGYSMFRHIRLRVVLRCIMLSYVVSVKMPFHRIPEQCVHGPPTMAAQRGASIACSQIAYYCMLHLACMASDGVHMPLA